MQEQSGLNSDDLGVLSSTLPVVQQASAIAIDQRKTAVVAARLAAQHIELPPWDRELHFDDGTWRTANFVLILDALNFCFWGEPRWRIEYKGRVLDGYWALAASLKRAIEEGVPVLEAGYLAHVTQPDLEYIFRGDGRIPLIKERLDNLHEVGAVLSLKYAGRFARAIELSDRSAVELVGRIVADFPSFNDVARWRAKEVRFYKRAQICVADLYGAFSGRGLGLFDDVDQLTAFADYKVPQMLRHLGILQYKTDLAERIERRELLPPGSSEEVEIRASTIWAVEYLRRALAGRGRALCAFEVDWYLWNQSQREDDQVAPYHRTRTIFY